MFQYPGLCSYPRGPGLTPGPGTKSPQAAQCSLIKNREKKRKKKNKTKKPNNNNKKQTDKAQGK